MRHKFTYTRIIALSFIAIIIVGSLLLSLPAASRTGEWTPYGDALFTATSATCVTGLVVYDTYTHWSLFGQLVILLMIQIGGLGFMTVLTTVSMLLGKNIGLHERKLLMQSAGSLQLGGVVAMLRRILIGTFACEGIGAVALFFSFYPDMGAARGIYNAIFHSVSAFCNAGFDLMGRTGQFSSMTSYGRNPAVNLTLAVLILVGGIGFLVWNDIAKKGIHFSKYSLHTKLVLTVTCILAAGGAILFCIFENDAAFAGMNPIEKVVASIFQSVTPRTAGFNAVDYASLSDSGSILTMVLMLIGGAPGSTAGGIKITTMAVLVLGAVAVARNRGDIVIFKKRLETSLLRQASAVFSIYMLAVIASSLIICAVQPALGLKNVVFETISAVGTVGLTMGITPMLSAVSKAVIALLMFTGRVGGLTFALMLAEGREVVPVNRPTEKIMIG